MSRFYDEKYKWGLYVRYRNGRTLTQLCDETGITDKPLREWFRNLDQLYKQVCSVRLDDIRRWNSQINVELQKKCNERVVLRQIFETIPEILRIACAHPLLERYGPNQVCRVLKIRKSNLYYQIFRKPTVTVYEKHNQELRPVIQAICASTPKRIGAEAIRRQLMERGYTASKEKVLELLHEIQPWKFVQTKKEVSRDDWQIGPTNLLARRFMPPRPNMVWVGDITEIKTDARTYYFCAILDLFAKRVIGARLSSRKDAFLTCFTFQDAFIQRGKPQGLLFHSDQGPQYTASDFSELLCRSGVTQSFSTPGVPYDNAPMESFFASLKTEEIYRYRYHGISDLTRSLQEYIAFYNHKRPHSSAKNLAPAEAEQLYFEQQNAASESADCVLLARKKICGQF